MSNINVKQKMIVGVLCGMLALLGVFFVPKMSGNANAQADGAAQQAMPVTVEVVSYNPVQIWNDYSTRLEAVSVAEIRPQVSGAITEVKFEDGQSVVEGDILYVIDPRPYQAAVNQTKAEVSRAKNQSSLTWKELKRARELIKTNAISKRILDERSSAHSVAASTVKVAEAALESAQINLDYAYVKAPISGRTGRVEVKKGNLVSAGAGAPILTSIVSLDGIFADFEVDEQSYLKYVRRNARDRAAENKIAVKLQLGNDGAEYDGFIHSFDNQIDATSGTIRARALFDNADGALLPGMFSTVKMGSPSTSDKILMTELAIGTDQNRKFVYVVNDKNMVEYREVTLGESVAGKRVIESGLNAGDKVIVDGVIRIRPGMPVDPQIKSDKKLNADAHTPNVGGDNNASSQDETE